ncbi:dihydrodipicolinate synthase family protein [Streptomyces antimycoticus]|uniref:dihydrodipicolinate synthase family protein n=1 Tax=Streptomyces antimycoticus TaxID=68175 RepID=UPI0033C21648
MIVGIGALRTRHVLEAAEDAQSAGAAGVLLAPVSYQPLTDDEVFGLFEDVTAGLSVPLVVYDNPRTTRFTFTDELYARLGRLPRVASIKIPGVPAASAAARARGGPRPRRPAPAAARARGGPRPRRPAPASSTCGTFCPPR